MALLIPSLHMLLGMIFIIILFHLISLSDPRNRRWHIYLLINAFAGAGYMFFSPAYYQLESAEQYIAVIRGQMFFTPIFVSTYLLFIRNYGGLRVSKGAKVAMVLFCLFPFARLCDPYVLTYSGMNGMNTLILPWGEKITRAVPVPNAVGIAYYLTVLGIIVLIIWSTLRGSYRSKVEHYIANGVSAVLALAGVADVVIDSFALALPYLGEFSFAAIMVLSTLMLITDLISARKTRVDLAISEQKYALLVDKLPLCLWMRNERQDVEFLSQAGKEMFGDKRLTREQFLELLHPEDRLALEDLWENEDSSLGDREYRVLIQGREHTVRDREAGVVDFGSEQVHIGFIEDMTELREVEHKREKLAEQLHQAQKMEAVGQLAGGVAHDFNNALGGIVGAAELLKSGGFSVEEQTNFIDMILTSADRAGDLTKKLLTFSRKGTKNAVAVDCLKIVNDTASLLEHTINKDITVVVENRAIQTSVIGDASMLQNALMNIGINASHAMPNGGVLTFALENLELDAEYCEVSPFAIVPGEYLELSIRDTGCGMSPEIKSRIFEPFFTTKEAGKGTGLGMAAVYGTVQEHNGAITVYSEVGQGTVFRLYFPVTAESVRRDVVPVSDVTGTGTILVIDDEEMIRLTASALLRSLGYRVILATNGQEGVETFGEVCDEIDLVILDMMMPVMGGREAFLKLRDIDPTIPVIIASGFAKEEDMAQLRSLGINGFLNKPFRKAELAEVVARSIRKEGTA